MDRKVKVSVVVPMYNASRYLPTALDSIVNQTLEDIEIICVDDGSTDSTYEILRNYLRRDHRFVILTESNSGPGFARNNGFRCAHGEYVLFFDADDFMKPETLETMYNRAVADDLDVLIGTYDVYDDGKQTYSPAYAGMHTEIYAQGTVTSKNEHPDVIFQSTVIASWNKLVRRKFIEDKKITFLTDCHIYEDCYFTVAVLSLAERVEKLDEVMIHHRVYPEQAANKKLRKYYTEIPTALLAMKEFLRQNGMLAPLSTSFLNLSADSCRRLYEILWQDAKRDFWTNLRAGTAAALGWYGHTADEFASEETCRFVAEVEMYTFDQYINREESGQKFHMTTRVHEVLMYGRNRTKALVSKFTDWLDRVRHRTPKVVSEVEEAEKNEAKK